MVPPVTIVLSRWWRNASISTIRRRIPVAAVKILGWVTRSMYLLYSFSWNSSRCNFWHAKVALAPSLGPRGRFFVLLFVLESLRRNSVNKTRSTDFASCNITASTSNHLAGLLTLLKTRSFCATARINYQNIALTSLIRPAIVMNNEGNERRATRKKKINRCNCGLHRRRKRGKSTR